MGRRAHTGSPLPCVTSPVPFLGNPESRHGTPHSADRALPPAAADWQYRGANPAALSPVPTFIPQVTAAPWTGSGGIEVLREFVAGFLDVLHRELTCLARVALRPDFIERVVFARRAADPPHRQ